MTKEKKETLSQYEIRPLSTDKSNVPLRKCMKDGTLAKYPSSTLISARSGGGKTCLLLNLLTRREFLKDYYHCIVVFSPTAGTSDDTYDCLKLPPENFIKVFDESKFEEIIQSRKDMIKDKGISYVMRNCRMCIILDDCIAERSFLNGPIALKMFTLMRHWLISVFMLTQSFMKAPRSLRINCNQIFVFPSSQSEIERLVEEVSPPHMKKRDFEKVLDFACNEKHSFLSINNHADLGKRIRKNLTEIVDLEKFKTKGSSYYQNNQDKKYIDNDKDNEEH